MSRCFIGDEQILVPPVSPVSFFSAEKNSIRSKNSANQLVILPRFAGPAVTPVATARIFPVGAGRLRKQTSVFCGDFCFGSETYVDQHNLGSSFALV